MWTRWHPGWWNANTISAQHSLFVKTLRQFLELTPFKLVIQWRSALPDLCIALRQGSVGIIEDIPFVSLALFRFWSSLRWGLLYSTATKSSKIRGWVDCVICFRFWFHVILAPSSSYFLTFIIYLVGGSVTISSKHPACTPNLLPWPILSCVQHNLKLPSLYFKWGDENSQSCALPGQWKQSDNPGASKHKNRCTSTSNVTTTITTTNSNNSSSRNDNNNSKQQQIL